MLLVGAGVGIVLVVGQAAVEDYRVSPRRFSDAVRAGVDLSSVNLFPQTGSRYTYSFSPIDEYLAYERRFLPVDAELVGLLVDGIAEAVAWRMLLASGAEDPTTAEAMLWARGEGRRIPEWIAEELAKAGVIYAQETLLSRSVDPALHDTVLYHLDCDLISHVFLHVGYRLDLDLREISSPLHTYLYYAGPQGEPLYIEPTAFRQTTVRDGMVEVGRIGVGPGFFIRSDYHRERGSVRASPELVTAAGFYEIATERDIRDGIVSEVMVGLSGLARQRDDVELMATVGSELAAHLEGTRDPNLVSNLFLHHLHQGEAALVAGDLVAAQAEVDAARQLRGSHDALLVHSEPMESVLAAQVLAAGGERVAAVSLLESICAEYDVGKAELPVAQSATHADALLTLAGLVAPGRSAYNRLVLPILNFEARVFSGGNSDRRIAAWRLCGEMLAGVDPDRAAVCEAEAEGR
ncbi:MAG: hypothetical protein ACI8RZ_001550 [Myxococcota bacterium]